jgi:hypothetical protein
VSRANVFNERADGVGGWATRVREGSTGERVPNTIGKSKSQAVTKNPLSGLGFNLTEPLLS